MKKNKRGSRSFFCLRGPYKSGSERPHQKSPVPTNVSVSRAEAALIPWLVLFAVFSILLVSRLRCAGASLVTEDFLDAMEFVESGRDARAVGDSGLAHGAFQFQAAAWGDVNRMRERRGMARVPFLSGAHGPSARWFARAHLLNLESSIASASGSHPTKEQLFAAWNLGLEGFRRRGFLLHRCPSSTRRAAQAVSAYQSGIACRPLSVGKRVRSSPAPRRVPA